MKLLKWNWLILLLALVSCEEETRCDNDFQGKDFQKHVIGFYPNWKTQELPIQNIQWEYLTRVIYAFAHPTEAGALVTNNLYKSEKLVKTAHENGVEAFLSIGGGGGKSAHFGKMAAQKESRQRFVKEVVAYTERYCFDGIDIDWEYLSYTSEAPTRLEQKALIVLLQDLKKALKPIGKELSIDVYGSIWAGRFFLDEVIDYVDYVHIMAYDFSGKWSEAMPHSSFEQAFGIDTKEAPSGVHYWANVRKWPRYKLILGVPFYGRDFNDKNVKGKPFKEIIKDSPMAFNQNEVNQIFYNGVGLVRRKAKKVKLDGLGGIMVWELTQDHEGRHSLLKTIGEELIEN
ncbi:MAG: glycoside hydrolase family 18 protein [Saprospiraceae bacterium]